MFFASSALVIVLSHLYLFLSNQILNNRRMLLDCAFEKTTAHGGEVPRGR
jgi:hypothetical protein